MRLSLLHKLLRLLKSCWTPVPYPDLSAIPAGEHPRIWMDCHLLALMKGRTWVGALGCGACGALGIRIGGQFHLALWGLVIGAVIGSLVFSRLMHYAVLEVVRERYPAPEPGNTAAQ